MIITRLVGGLGNQMFQYAVARHLAGKNGSQVKLDISMMGANGGANFTARDYELGIFRFPQAIASAREVAELTRVPSAPVRGIGKVTAAMARRRQGPVITERSMRFDPAVLRARGNIYLSGYWQSEKYFREIGDTLRSDFVFSAIGEGVIASTREEILAAENAVAVHVRRGDYAHNAHTRSVHGLLSLDYYERALSRLAVEFDGVKAFVFSDDRDWVRKNLRSSVPITVVDTGDASARADFELMTRCRHYVIANSSFSWWAAWLGEKPHSRVIAPSAWFATDSMDGRDVVPERWLRV